LLEWTRLASYPDDFRHLEKKVACPLIGNSVPPLLMKAVAEHIRDKILGGVISTPTLQEVPCG
jgi:DNA (cytosine-5)-methyltransferase 1